MKHYYHLGLAMLASSVWPGRAPQPWSQGRGQGFRPCPYSPYTCPVSNLCRPLNDRGKVVQVRTEMIEAGMYPGMALLVDTKTQGQVLVHLGPGLVPGAPGIHHQSRRRSGDQRDVR